MKIYYTNKLIFWSNKGNDYVEKSVFDAYLPDNEWTEVRATKSINWTDHYNANFYASDSFDATYFKVVKGTEIYYFFVEDYEFDSNRGKQFKLSLDFYNTYVLQLIEKLKLENPNVVFKRKHASRKPFNVLNAPYLLNVPSYLKSYEQFKAPTQRLAVEFTRKTKTFSNFISSGITVNDNDYVSLNKYWYVKVQRPPVPPVASTAGPWKAIATNTIYYFPIKNENVSPSATTNIYANACKWPSSYVVGMIETNVPPSYFAHAGKVKDLYGTTQIEGADIPFFKTSEDIVLIGDFSTGSTYSFSTIPLLDYNVFSGSYNISNYRSEPILYTGTFLHYNINDSARFVLDYYFYNLTSSVTFSMTISISSKIYAIVNPAGSLLTNTIYRNTSFVLESELPFTGDNYNNYLLNNINAQNTSIALGKEQADMTKSLGTTQGILDLIAAGASTAVGAGMLFGTSGMFGHNFALSGVSGIANSIFGMHASSIQTDFQYKSVVQSIEAQRADAMNQPDKMLDTYGKGCAAQLMVNTMYVVKYEIPDDYKKLIFSDIYFNGYLTNSVVKFREYDNRRQFNYFELANSYALANQYLKLPKQILKDVAVKVESGLRLWKTSSFDYTMSLDNREN